VQQRRACCCGSSHTWLLLLLLCLLLLLLCLLCLLLPLLCLLLTPLLCCAVSLQLAFCKLDEALVENAGVKLVKHACSSTRPWLGELPHQSMQATFAQHCSASCRTALLTKPNCLLSCMYMPAHVAISKWRCRAPQGTQVVLNMHDVHQISSEECHSMKMIPVGLQLQSPAAAMMADACSDGANGGLKSAVQCSKSWQHLCDTCSHAPCSTSCGLVWQHIIYLEMHEQGICPHACAIPNHLHCHWQLVVDAAGQHGLQKLVWLLLLTQQYWMLLPCAGLMPHRRQAGMLPLPERCRYYHSTIQPLYVCCQRTNFGD
jgi:hypothetical protein